MVVHFVDPTGAEITDASQGGDVYELMELCTENKPWVVQEGAYESTYRIRGVLISPGAQEAWVKMELVQRVYYDC